MFEKLMPKVVSALVLVLIVLLLTGGIVACVRWIGGMLA